MRKFKALTVSGNTEQLNVTDSRTNLFKILISHTIGNTKIIKYSNYFWFEFLVLCLTHIHTYTHREKPKTKSLKSNNLARNVE